MNGSLHMQKVDFNKYGQSEHLTCLHTQEQAMKLMHSACVRTYNCLAVYSTNEMHPTLPWKGEFRYAVLQRLEHLSCRLTPAVAHGHLRSHTMTRSM